MTIPAAPAIPGFAYTKTSYEELVDRFLAIPGYTSELLGQSVNGRPIYGFGLGDFSKPTMYVEGNIHGNHEWRTCWWVSEFMKLLADPTLAPAHTTILNSLRAKYSFYFIPSVNPDGYGTPSANGRYGNANGVSVSENFDFNWSAGVHDPAGGTEYRGPFAWSEPESQIVRDKVLALQPISLLCNHSWGGHTGFTTRHPQNTAHEAAISEFYSAVTTALALDGTHDSAFSAKILTGSAYNWAGTQVSTFGVPIIAQVWESGDQVTELDQARVGMTGILYHMLMVDNMPASYFVPAGPPVAAASWGPLRVNGADRPVVAVDTVIGGELRAVWRP